MRRTLAAPRAPEEQIAGSRDPAISPPAPPSRVPEVFGPGGLLARAFPGYEPRPQQAAMAAAVERATDRGEHLLFEAPCGVGKSVAYLAPAILRAVPKGRRVLVVTANIALQEQLCIGPDEKVLTADLVHVPAAEIRVGMKLLGFDEERVGERRRLQTSVVLAVERIRKPSFRLDFDDGTTVTCSHDHLWLCSRSDTVQWQASSRMVPAGRKRKGSGVVRVTDLWETDETYAGGYLAAAVDGEGWLSQKRSRQYNGFTTKLGFSQNKNAMLDEVRRLFAEAGLNFSEKRHGRDHCRRLEIYERSSVLKFLGKYRPKRLLALFNPDMLGTLPTQRRVRLVRKVDLGEQEVISITTTTRTLIVNGLASHNCNKDLPGLRAILPVPFTFAIAKGRAQWLCEEQFAETRAEVARRGKLKVLGAANAHRWEELEAWAMRTQTGDLSELTSFDVGAVRQHVAVSADECAGPSCPSRKECHAERAKAEFWKADVVVTNYAMFLLDLQLRVRSEGEAGVLPAWDVLVLDEAHACADIARDHFGARATEGTVRHAARLLDRGDDAVAPDVADDLRAEAARFFADLLEYRRSRDYRVRFKRPGELPGGSHLCALLTVGAEALTRAASAEDNGARRQRMRSGARRMLEVGQLLRDAHSLARPEAVVYFAEVEGAKGHERAALGSRLVHPSEVLREHLFKAEGRSVIMCSATLATGDVEDPRSFDFIRSELGCDSARTRALGVSSPFDLARQALLCAPRIGAGAKDRDDHEAACARAIVALAHATRGRLLAVFTSRRGLSKAREAFDEVPSADCTWTELLVQGDAPRTELVRRFKAALRPAELCPACGTDVGSRAFCDCPARPPTRWPMHGAVLLGLDSFREGVDVPGEALSVVVLDRLPFATPDDPVLDAVDQATPGGAFMSWMLPRAITGFRQLVGRGVRRLDDRAAVVVLDDRLVSKGYGRKFTRAVAPIPLSRDLEDAVRFVGGDVGEGSGQ